MTTSAGEKHATQLSKWEIEFFEEKEIHAKQILIINGFKGLPIDERAEDVFPNQMLPYCVKQEQCLITSIQLLCLFIDCNGDEQKIQGAIEELISTNGIYQKYQDHQNYLAIEEITNE